MTDPQFFLDTTQGAPVNFIDIHIVDANGGQSATAASQLGEAKRGLRQEFKLPLQTPNESTCARNRRLLGQIRGRRLDGKCKKWCRNDYRPWRVVCETVSDCAGCTPECLFWLYGISRRARFMESHVNPELQPQLPKQTLEDYASRGIMKRRSDQPKSLALTNAI